MLLLCFSCSLHLGQCQKQDSGPGGHSVRSSAAALKEPGVNISPGGCGKSMLMNQLKGKKIGTSGY